MKLTEFYFHFNNYIFNKNSQIIKLSLNQISDNQTNKKYSVNEIIYLLGSIGYHNIKKFIIKNEENRKFNIDISNIFSEDKKSILCFNIRTSKDFVNLPYQINTGIAKIELNILIDNINIFIKNPENEDLKLLKKYITEIETTVSNNLGAKLENKFKNISKLEEKIEDYKLKIYSENKINKLINSKLEIFNESHNYISENEISKIIDSKIDSKMDLDRIEKSLEEKISKMIDNKFEILQNKIQSKLHKKFTENYKIHSDLYEISIKDKIDKNLTSMDNKINHLTKYLESKMGIYDIENKLNDIIVDLQNNFDIKTENMNNIIDNLQEKLKDYENSTHDLKGKYKSLEFIIKKNEKDFLEKIKNLFEEFKIDTNQYIKNSENDMLFIIENIRDIVYKICEESEKLSNINENT